MRRDLVEAYIPACVDCQRNKSATSKPAGPLHPLPVPDGRGDSVAIDFIGPLPIDENFNRIVSMTDRMGSDIRIVPTRTDIDAEGFALLFFREWHCEKGLPREIVSDRDKIFTSKFWKALHRLSGVKLKMSMAFHPESDGSSERTNETVNQAIRFHVQRKKKGWVRCLRPIGFQIMNTVNASTGFSPFQPRMGRYPRVIPPLVIKSGVPLIDDAELRAKVVMERLELDVQEARDKLLMAKVQQVHANDKIRPDPGFEIGDHIMLSTLHRRREFEAGHPGRVAKFFPRYDGPYEIIDKHPNFSTYALDLPNSPNAFPTFHVSVLKHFTPNDANLFPSREHARPGPIVTPDGVAGFAIDRIVDERRRGRGMQYLVCWVGYGPLAPS
jgi:hypothetical protein